MILKRAAFVFKKRAGIYTALQLIRQAADNVTVIAGELLPHLLTLVLLQELPAIGRLFSSLLLSPHEDLLFRRMMLCVVRTFLFAYCEAIDRPTLDTKILKFIISFILPYTPISFAILSIY